VNDRTLDPWLAERLACPRDHTGLVQRGEELVCDAGHRYPCVGGIPVMVLDDVRQTHWLATQSLEVLHEADSPSSPDGIDSYVRSAIGATCGYLYEPIKDRFQRYPIPDFRWAPTRPGDVLLDIGCHWGRWCFSAARAGYTVVGLDPSLRGVRAARRVAAQLGLEGQFVVGDARFLPFRLGAFDVAFSYSVLQHFANSDVVACLAEVQRALVPGGRAIVQMPTVFGLRNLFHQAGRGFAEPREFLVRYWRLEELRRVFGSQIGPTTLSVDGFFSLNAQAADLELLPPHFRVVVRASEALRWLADRFPAMMAVADSVYVESTKKST
jgi:SAM-dependent methyltransferase/uncharacterized protein YbaR (Trm112 family)